MNNEELHNDIREKLSKLPRLKARDGFENELLRRINLLEPLSPKSAVQKSSIWEILFGKRALVWTIPATSLAVIGIIFFAVYLFKFKSDVNNTATDKQTVTSEVQKKDFPEGSNSQETTKNNIPGKDIVNDLEIGKSTEVERRDAINKGLNETYIQPSPKSISNPKENVIDSKKETTTYDKADETGKVVPKEYDGNNNKGVLKEERKTEETKKAKEPEKKISSPLIKEGEKNKSERNEVDSKEKTEIKQKEDTKRKDEAKQKEEARVKEEAKQKEEAKRKEEIKKQEEATRIEEARKQEEARKKEEVRKKEEARVKEEARKQEEARKKEEARKQEEAKKKELEKLKEQIKEN